jgi:hypothetical protein
MAAIPLKFSDQINGTYYARDYGVAADGVTDDQPAITALLASVGALGGGIVYLPRGTVNLNIPIVRPAVPGLQVLGQGMEVTRLVGHNGCFVYNTPTRIFRCRLADMTLNGNNTAGSIGIDDADVDRSWYERLRVIAFDTNIKITSTGGGSPRGALHNRFIDIINTNGISHNYWLTGAQGPHETMIVGGECSISPGIGLRIDSPTDSTRVFGVTFESNGLAIKQSGSKGWFNCRFEGNTQDTLFDTTAAYNVLYASQFDPTKHKDIATGAGIGSNVVHPYGVWTSTTEKIRTIYVPGNPLLQLNASVVGTSISANNALSQMFMIEEMHKISAISFMPKTSTGNVACAITDSAGTILGSTITTVMGTAGTRMDVPLTEAAKAITAATNASPIQITATAHGYSTGDQVFINGVTGNTAANNTFATGNTALPLWTITVIDANNFTLNGSTGNGAYVSGGLVGRFSPIYLTPRRNYYASIALSVGTDAIAGITGNFDAYNLTRVPGQPSGASVVKNITSLPITVSPVSGASGDNRAFLLALI